MDAPGVATVTRYPRVAAVMTALLLVGGGLGAGSGLVWAARRAVERVGIALSLPETVLLSAVLIQGVAFGGISGLYLKLRGKRLSWVGVELPGLRGWLTIASGYVLAFLGAMAAVVLVILSGLDPAANQTQSVGMADPLVFGLLVPISFLLIGPGEELLFRGIIQNALVEGLGRLPGIALATVLFAGAHVFSLTGPLTGRATTILLLLVPGLVLALSYAYSKNIVVPAMVHGAYNATLFGIAYLGALSAG